MNTIDFTEKEEKQRSNIAMSGICLLRSIRQRQKEADEAAVFDFGDLPEDDCPF